MKTITVNFSKWRSALILFINLLYSVVIISWIFVAWTFLFLVIPLVIFLAWNIKKTWQELTGKRPALVLDKDGIIDNIHWYSLGRVGWEEIDAIQSKQFFWIKNIRVMFKSPSAVIQKEKNFLKRLFQSVQWMFNKTPMLLNAKTLPISDNELAALLKDIDFENPDFVDMSEHLVD